MMFVWLFVVGLVQAQISNLVCSDGNIPKELVPEFDASGTATTALGWWYGTVNRGSFPSLGTYNGKTATTFHNNPYTATNCWATVVGDWFITQPCTTPTLESAVFYRPPTTSHYMITEHSVTIQNDEALGSVDGSDGVQVCARSMEDGECLTLGPDETAPLTLNLADMWLPSGQRLYLEVDGLANNINDRVGLKWTFKALPYTCVFTPGNRLLVDSMSTFMDGNTHPTMPNANGQLFFDLIPAVDIYFEGFAPSYATTGLKQINVHYSPRRSYASIVNAPSMWQRLFQCTYTVSSTTNTTVNFCGSSPMNSASQSSAVILRAGVTYAFSITHTGSTTTFAMRYLDFNSTGIGAEGDMHVSNADLAITVGRARNSGATFSALAPFPADPRAAFFGQVRYFPVSSCTAAPVLVCQDLGPPGVVVSQIGPSTPVSRVGTEHYSTADRQPVYSVVLAAQPITDVTVAFDPLVFVTGGINIPRSLRFTSVDWASPQTVFGDHTNNAVEDVNSNSFYVHTKSTDLRYGTRPKQFWTYKMIDDEALPALHTELYPSTAAYATAAGSLDSDANGVVSLFVDAPGSAKVRYMPRTLTGGWAMMLGAGAVLSRSCPVLLSDLIVIALNSADPTTTYDGIPLATCVTAPAMSAFLVVTRDTGALVGCQEVAPVATGGELLISVPEGSDNYMLAAKVKLTPGLFTGPRTLSVLSFLTGSYLLEKRTVTVAAGPTVSGITLDYSVPAGNFAGASFTGFEATFNETTIATDLMGVPNTRSASMNETFFDLISPAPHDEDIYLVGTFTGATLVQANVATNPAPGKRQIFVLRAGVNAALTSMVILWSASTALASGTGESFADRVSLAPNGNEIFVAARTTGTINLPAPFSTRGVFYFSLLRRTGALGAISTLTAFAAATHTVADIAVDSEGFALALLITSSSHTLSAYCYSGSYPTPSQSDAFVIGYRHNTFEWQYRIHGLSREQGLALTWSLSSLYVSAVSELLTATSVVYGLNNEFITGTGTGFILLKINARGPRCAVTTGEPRILTKGLAMPYRFNVVPNSAPIFKSIFFHVTTVSAGTGITYPTGTTFEAPWTLVGSGVLDTTSGGGAGGAALTVRADPASPDVDATLSFKFSGTETLITGYEWMSQKTVTFRPLEVLFFNVVSVMYVGVPETGSMGIVVPQLPCPTCGATFRITFGNATVASATPATPSADTVFSYPVTYSPLAAGITSMTFTYAQGGYIRTASPNFITVTIDVRRKKVLNALPSATSMLPGDTVLLDFIANEPPHRGGLVVSFWSDNPLEAQPLGSQVMGNMTSVVSFAYRPMPRGYGVTFSNHTYVWATVANDLGSTSAAYYDDPTLFGNCSVTLYPRAITLVPSSVARLDTQSATVTVDITAAPPTAPLTVTVDDCQTKCTLSSSASVTIIPPAKVGTVSIASWQAVGPVSLKVTSVSGPDAAYYDFDPLAAPEAVVTVSPDTPTVTSFSPLSIPCKPITLTVYGNNLRLTSSITFAGSACLDPIVSDPAGAFAVCPRTPVVATSGPIVVSASHFALGTLTLSPPTGFNAYPLPAITSVVPAQASVLNTTRITVSGSFFTGSTLSGLPEVMVGGVHLCTPVSHTDAEAVCDAATPGLAATGPMDVTVRSTLDDCASFPAAGALTYAGAPPDPVGLTCSLTSTAGTVQISATVPPGWDPLYPTLGFSVHAANVSGSSTVVVPSFPALVTLPIGVRSEVTITALNSITVSAPVGPVNCTALPAPVVTASSRAHLPLRGGLAITLTGSGFNAPVSASVGGAPCNSTTVLTTTSLVCVTPPAPSGPGPASVQVKATLGGIMSAPASGLVRFVPDKSLNLTAPAYALSGVPVGINVTSDSELHQGLTVSLAGTVPFASSVQFMPGASGPNPSTTVVGEFTASGTGLATLTVAISGPDELFFPQRANTSILVYLVAKAEVAPAPFFCNQSSEVNSVDVTFSTAVPNNDPKFSVTGFIIRGGVNDTFTPSSPLRKYLLPSNVTVAQLFVAAVNPVGIGPFSPINATCPTYPAPNVTAASPYHIDERGGQLGPKVLTLYGVNFQPLVTTVEIGMRSVDHWHACANVSVALDGASLTCVIPPRNITTWFSLGDELEARVFVGGATGLAAALVNATSYFDFYVPPPPPPPPDGRPLITAVLPAYGPSTGGVLLTLFGNSLVTPGAAAVNLVEMATNATYFCSSLTPFNATSLTCLTTASPSGPFTFSAVPRSASPSGSKAAVPSWVTAQFYALYPPPVLLDCSPMVLSAQGGTTITVRGLNFGESAARASPLALTVGGAPCLSPTWISSTSVTCVAGPSANATVTVDMPVTMSVAGRAPTSVTFATLFGGDGLYYGTACDPPCAPNALCTAGTCSACRRGFAGPPLCASRPISAVLDDPSRAATAEEGTFVVVRITRDPSVSGTVDVEVEVDDLTEAVVAPLTVTLSAEQDTAKVVVTGLKDDVRDGNVTFNLRFSLAGAPLAGLYAPPPIALVNNDASPLLVNFTPATVPRVGSRCVLVAANVDPLFSIYFDKSRATLTAIETNTTDLGNGLMQINFTCPASPVDGYQTLTLSNLVGTSASNPSLVYYTDVCAKPGQYGTGSACRDCPTGAECPGGYRIWAKPGYWNRDEYDENIRECSPMEACIGLVDGVPQCAPGYGGPYCSECLPGYAKNEIGDGCRLCPPPAQRTANMLGDLILWVSFAFACVTITRRITLSYVVDLIRALQMLGGLGSMSNGKIPDWAIKIYTFLKIFSGDYALVKTNCDGTTPFKITFGVSLAYTCAIFMPTFLFVAIAKRLVPWYVRRHGKGASPAEVKDRARLWRKFYEDRLVRCLIICLTIAYLSVASLTINALSCEKVGTRRFMVTNMSEECFKGDNRHVGTAAIILIIIYVFGFPAIMLRHISQKDNKDKLFDNNRFMEKYNFLYEFYNKESPTVWIIEFPILCVIGAAKSYLKYNPVTQLVLCLIFFGMKLLYIIFKRPFIDALTDCVQAVFCIVSLLAINITFMGARLSRVFDAAKIDRATSGALVAMITLMFIGVAILLGIIVLLLCKKKPPPGEEETKRVSHSAHMASSYFDPPPAAKLPPMAELVLANEAAKEFTRTIDKAVESVVISAEEEALASRKSRNSSPAKMDHEEEGEVGWVEWARRQLSAAFSGGSPDSDDSDSDSDFNTAPEDSKTRDALAATSSKTMGKRGDISDGVGDKDTATAPAATDPPAVAVESGDNPASSVSPPPLIQN